jgi:hypothetical protein
LGVSLELPSFVQEKLPIESEYKRVFRPRQRDVEQSFHFLPLDLFDVVFELVEVRPIENNV